MGNSQAVLKEARVPHRSRGMCTASGRFRSGSTSRGVYSSLGEHDIQRVSRLGCLMCMVNRDEYRVVGQSR